MISAWDKSLDLLSRAEHSALDLKRKLRNKGYDQEEIDEVIRRLYSVGYLSDERYARAYLRKFLPVKSVHLICRELGQKGIALAPEDPLVSEVLEEEGIIEDETVLSLISRKLRGNDQPDEKERRRLYAYLQRRGFSYHTIEKAMSSLGV